MWTWLFASLLFTQLLPSASHDAFWQGTVLDGQVLRPCEADSADRRDAQSKLREWSEAVGRLKATDSARASVRQLHTLLTHPCFLMAWEAGDVPEPDSAQSLQFWLEHGGSIWLSSFLELPEVGDLPATRRHVVTLPVHRSTLDLESAREHPLRDLLCARGDTQCGAATRGWLFRADRFFYDNPVTDTFERPAQMLGDQAVGRECERETVDHQLDVRYFAWRRCVEGKRPRYARLPIGQFKAPTTGWLIINGRRGHYDFCDSTRAYNLATGQAFVHDDCSALVLEAGGTVDSPATDRARRLTVTAGQVPLENLREAMLIIALQSEMRIASFSADTYALPDASVRQVAVGPVASYGSMSMSFSTAQTTLTWRWVRDGAPTIGGEIIWPGSMEPHEDHASTLLRVAEEGLVPGCAARSRPPDRVVHPPGKDADRRGPNRDGYINDFDAALTLASAAWARLPSCGR
ncbi:MAG: hypothetical protein IT178_02420 [Acidobacteria bacterium]|nr:hypothetical protein [Acidobacteriota bacterium]